VLAAGHEPDPFDPVGHELRPPGHSGKADPGRRGEGRKLAEQVEEIGLVPRAAAAEDVSVDDDEWRAQPAARS